MEEVKFKHIIGFIIAMLLLWVGFRIFSKPSMRSIRTGNPVFESTVSFPETYDSLFLVDQKAHRTFLENEATYSIVINNHFPYSTQKFGTQKTKAILRILNDSSMYQWGEIGTPFYDEMIVFYGKDQDQIGFADICLMGEVDAYPYRSLMKWGALTDEGFDKLLQILNE